jgi:hypothetical protein
MQLRFFYKMAVKVIHNDDDDDDNKTVILPVSCMSVKLGPSL